MSGLTISNGGATTTFPLTTIQQASFNNGTALLLPKWRAAVGKVRARTSSAKVLCLGDSTTFGVGTGNLGANDDLKILSYPTQLMKMFNASGTNAHANSFFAAGFSNVTYNTNNDHRLTVTGGWTYQSGVTLGGQLWQIPSGDTGVMAFTPSSPVDTFVIYYLKIPTLSTLSASINGGTPVTADANAANTMATFTITGTLGINTLSIRTVATGAAGNFIMGIEAYDSSKKWVHFCNVGCPSAKASDLSSTSLFYSPLNAIGAFAPDLTILMDGINDWSQGVSPSTFSTQMQSIITKAKTYGDCIIVSPIPSAITGANSTPAATQIGLVNIMSTLAISNNIAYIDLYTRAGPQANNLVMYYQNTDWGHFNEIGYGFLAQTVFNVIGNT